MPTPLIILLGLRGSGKSTTGHLLAEHLGTSFVDLDQRTPRVLHCATVAEAWSAHGEPAFRTAEVIALNDVLRTHQRAVIALGGGTPTAPGAADLLRDAKDAGRAMLVLLRASPGTLRTRLATADNAHRPSLTTVGSNLDEIETIYAQRMPLYESLASITIDVDDVTAEQCLTAIRRVIDSNAAQ